MIHNIKRYAKYLVTNMRFSSTFTLRDYQEECISTCLNAFYKNKIRRQAICLPVGSGKTVSITSICL